MAGKVLIINHFIIPTVSYFLACWRPPERALAQFNSLCRNFLWSGSTTDYKVPKVKWDTCILKKDKGGLGIPNIIELANRLASKWIVRSMLYPEEDWWAVLIHMKIHLAELADHPRWKGIPQLTLLLSKWPVKIQASPLVKSLWAAWNQIKGMTVLRSNKAAIPYIAQDSVWWPMGGMKQVCSEDYEKARKLNNKGIKTWGDLWDHLSHSWLSDQLLDRQVQSGSSRYHYLKEQDSETR